MQVQNVLPMGLAASFKGIKHVPYRYFDVVTKINKAGRSQQRALVCTSEHMYSCLPEEGDIQRCIAFLDVRELMICRNRNSVAVIVPAEYDMYLQTATLESLERLLFQFPEHVKFTEQDISPGATGLRLEKPGGFTRAIPASVAVDYPPKSLEGLREEKRQRQLDAQNMLHNSNNNNVEDELDLLDESSYQFNSNARSHPMSSRASPGWQSPSNHRAAGSGAKSPAGAVGRRSPQLGRMGPQSPAAERERVGWNTISEEVDEVAKHEQPVKSVSRTSAAANPLVTNEAKQQYQNQDWDSDLDELDPPLQRGGRGGASVRGGGGGLLGGKTVGSVDDRARRGAAAKSSPPTRSSAKNKFGTIHEEVEEFDLGGPVTSDSGGVGQEHNNALNVELRRALEYERQRTADMQDHFADVVGAQHKRITALNGIVASLQEELERLSVENMKLKRPVPDL